MSEIGLFYGSSTCYTEMAAEKIQQQLSTAHGVEISLYNIAEAGIAPAADYRHLIFGIPTWDYGELQEDWEAVWDELDQIDFNGKTVAIYGLGDQLGYPQWFQDAVGYLHDKVESLGARMIGYWPNQGYEFEASVALNQSQSEFKGLALDEENQFELSEQRIADWCAQILAQFQQPV